LKDAAGIFFTSYLEYCCRTGIGCTLRDEFQSSSDALKGAEEKEWRLAIDSELASLKENKTWELVSYLKTVMLFRCNG
jgi:hypothetical protein